MFMDSSGHRANILGKNWDVIGVGAYKGPTGKKMWTVLFADKCGTASSRRPSRRRSRPPSRGRRRRGRSPSPRPKPTPKPTPEAHAEADARADADADAPTDRPGSCHRTRRARTRRQPRRPPTAAVRRNGRPPGQPGDGWRTGMRVVDPATGRGLLETIVGGVAGFFFGG